MYTRYKHLLNWSYVDIICNMCIGIMLQIIIFNFNCFFIFGSL